MISKPVSRCATPSTNKPFRRDLRLLWLGAVTLTFGWLLWYGAGVEAPPYRAPVLELSLSGAFPATLSLTSTRELAEMHVSAQGFRFATKEQPIDFVLAFGGDKVGGDKVGTERPNRVYDLSASSNLLTLTLMSEGRAYHRFSANQGSVTLSEDGGDVAAVLIDTLGRQVRLSGRFNRAEVRGCSESYYFCFDPVRAAPPGASPSSQQTYR